MTPEFQPGDVGDLAQYLPLVRNMAHGMRARLGANAELDELYADGSLGLVKASRTWAGKVPFRAYAIFMVRREMFAGFNRNSIVSRYGAEKKGVRCSVMSLDQPISEGSGLTFADTIADGRECDPCRSILFREVMDVVAKTRPIDQQRVADLLADNDVKGKRGQDSAERARVRSARWLTLKTIRTMVDDSSRRNAKAS